jgi:hypothetical protein
VDSNIFYAERRIQFFVNAETRKVRDACVVEKGQENCAKEIEAHKVCLRLEGFDA